MLIHILRADGVEDDVDESQLDKREGVDCDTEEKTVRWVEYRFIGDDRIVHRSVDVHIKQWPGLGAGVGNLI